MRTQIQVQVHPELIARTLGLPEDAKIIGCEWDFCNRFLRFFIDCEEGRNQGFIRPTDNLVTSEFYAPQRPAGGHAPNVDVTYRITRADMEIPEGGEAEQ